MHTQILTGKQVELLPCMKAFSRTFYLAGGTAMALGVKITFLSYPFSIEHPVKLQPYMSLPTLLTLSSLKAYALSRRAKWKDYVDLYFILRDHFSIEQISREAIINFGTLYSEKLFREQLAFHRDIDFSEPVEFLVPVPSEDDIKQFLIDKATDISALMG